METGKWPDDAGIDALADHCHAEAASALPAAHPPIVPGVIQATAGGPKLILRRLSDIRGVNAFGPKAELNFADQLTVIYGANGSGKSGYARLLKHMCGAKAPEPILGNVFSNTMEPVPAVVSFRRIGLKDGQPFAQDNDHPWKGADGVLPPLAPSVSRH